jgi:aminoglycoside/choline kinase family phosphotransferase
MKQEIVALFERTYGKVPGSVERIAADGSRRLYWRLVAQGAGTESEGSPVSVIGAWGPDPDENRAFLSFTRTFRELDLPVPALHAVDEASGIWLLEDLGTRTLFTELTDARRALSAATTDPAESGEMPGFGGEFPTSVLPAYERVLDVLPRFQIEGGKAIDFSLAYPAPSFDRDSIRWDLNYFKYHFLKLAGVPFHEARLERDFERLADYLLAADGEHFLYRDLQSRNIMLREDGPWFIDYQGGRRGPLHYDVASLLYDGKAALPNAVRDHLLEHYLAALSGHMEVDGDTFRERFRGFVLIRIMQAMGAYGYRGFFERKALFRESVPHAARNLEGLLDSGLPVPVPELEGVFRRIVERWAGETESMSPEGGLTVRITSFSYRDGYPEDSSGHGGGFVFDCRSLPNPGRQSEFVDVTGRDKEVIAWLEGAPEVGEFWEQLHPLVERHVANYLDRNFSDFAVSFGCTGGQHRSVFMAERLAAHLRERFEGLNVVVQHREEPRWPGGLWTR